MEIKSSFKERLISKIKTFIYILLSPCHPHGSKWHIPPLLVRLSAVGFPTLECKQNSEPRFTFFSARTANPECSVFRMPRTMWPPHLSLPLTPFHTITMKFVNAAFLSPNTQQLLKTPIKSSLFTPNSCTTQIKVVHLQQQNPPRFPLDQRTRAGLLLLYLWLLR